MFDVSCFLREIYSDAYDFLPAAKEREVMLYETGLVDIEESFFPNL